jgi:hypothetical protein
MTGRGRSALPQRTRRRVNVRYIPSYIALLAVIISLGYGLTLSTQPKIVSVGSNSAHLLRENTVYRAAAQDILDNSIFSRSKLLINSDSVARQLQKRFPELRAVSVTVPIASRQPIITIQATQPTLLLAGESGAYLVDSEGVAVMKASELAEDVRTNLPIVTDETGAKLEVGQGALPTQTLQFIAELSRQLTAKNVQVSSMTLPAVANELHVRVVGEDYLIKFNVDGDARLQAGAYLATAEQLHKDGIRPQEYVDVRLEDRAFYK